MRSLKGLHVQISDKYWCVFSALSDKHFTKITMYGCGIFLDFILITVQFYFNKGLLR